MLGKTIGRYKILQQLGVGGMALVYKAFDSHLDTFVAIKVIRSDWLTLESSSKLLQRFEAEAKRLARLSHPNIIPILDYGKHEDIPYLVMKYLPGGTLKDRLMRPMHWREAARLLLPVARALSYAHQQGLIHRDVKPANILLTETGEPMLADFGLSKILYSDSTPGDLTGSAVVLGTPEYMAPEQALGQSIDARSDIYSLGLVFYEMVTGRRPFTANTPMGVAMKHITEPLPHPRQFVSDLPEPVERLLLRALAKEPENRFPSAAALCSVLERLVGSDEFTPQRPASEQVRTLPLDSPPPGSMTPAGVSPAAGTPLPAREATPLPGSQPAAPPARKGRSPLWITIAILGTLGVACLVVVIGATILASLPGASPTRSPVANTLSATQAVIAQAATSTRTPAIPTRTLPQPTRTADGGMLLETERARNRTARTATAAARVTAQAEEMNILLTGLRQTGAITSTTGTYQTVEDFDESWAQLGWYQYWSTGYSPSDFVIRAQTQWRSASRTADWYASGCGFVFRETDEKNHYLVYLGLDGNVYLKGYVDGTFKEYGREYVGGVEAVEGSAEVMLAVEGTRISYFVNGKQVLQRNLPDLNSGELSLTLVSGTNKDYGTRCEMTGIELWIIEAP